MDSTGASTSSSTTLYYSILDLIEIIFLEGINKIEIWDKLFVSMKKNLIEQPDTIINLYFTIFNALSNFFLDVDSQKTYILMKQKVNTFEEIAGYFSSYINSDHLHNKNLPIENIKMFKDLIKKSINTPNKIVDLASDSEDDTTTCDEFEREFESVLNSKKIKRCKKNITFEQSYQLTSNVEKKWIKTPGEEGHFLIDIRITDTRDLLDVKPEDWWKQINKKAVFLANSSQDELYLAVSDIMKNSFNRIKKIKHISSAKFLMTGNKFKPY